MKIYRTKPTDRHEDIQDKKQQTDRQTCRYTGQKPTDRHMKICRTKTNRQTDEDIQDKNEQTDT